MKHAHLDIPGPGPTLRAVPFGSGPEASVTRLLTDEQRQRLASVATREELPARALVYREHDPATAVFICSRGVAKSFRDLPSGARRVAAFLFQDDLFGLSDRGRYMNSVKTITPFVLYRLPTDQLTELLRNDPDLELQFLCKVTHELRQSQRRGIVLGRRDAVGRVAMFLQMLMDSQAHPTERGRLDLPMTRADIADYVAMSGEAVSRATTRLVKRGVITFDGQRAVRVIDRVQLEKIANTP